MASLCTRIYIFMFIGIRKGTDIFQIWLRKRIENRRECTIIRHNEVHRVYADMAKKYGHLIYNISKGYIYEEIRKQTGLCHKTIAYILNHTEEVEKL